VPGTVRRTATSCEIEIRKPLVSLAGLSLTLTTYIAVGMGLARPVFHRTNSM
jgi:hypothetical protein